MSTTPEKTNELGFGQTGGNQTRLINSDGSYNYQKIGVPWLERIQAFRWLTTHSWISFVVFILAGFFLLNLLFTGFYYLLGLEQLSGMSESTPWRKFIEVFSFSVQTATTVGYGRINPVGVGANIIAMFQVISGIFYTALITGLVWGRFAKPINGIRFSDQAIIAPFKSGQGLMLRLINVQNSSLMTAHVQVTLGYLTPNEQGQTVRQFISLDLERDYITFFVSNWTIVHPINEVSPFYNKSAADIEAMRPEVFILFTAYDEVFNSTIHARRSYAHEEIQYGFKFVKMFHLDGQGQPVVDVSKLSDVEKV
jgi:inward rectifier potassium channel